MTSNKVVVTGAGGFIGGHLVRELLDQGLYVRAVDMKPLAGWYQLFPEADNRQFDLRRPRGGRHLGSRLRHGLQPRRRHGRHGLHREQQGRLHAVGADQHAPARWPRVDAGVERYFYASSACVYAADKQRDPDVTALSEADAYPADARGRLRLGEAVQRADVPPLPRGLRARHPGRPLPQRLRPERHLRRRPREGARRHLPQGGRGQDERRARDRDLGRRRADPQLHVHRRLRVRHRGDPEQRHRVPDQPRQQRARDASTSSSTSSRTSPASSSSAATTCRRPQGVRGRNSDNTLIQAELGWEPTITLQDGLERTYRWIYDELAVAVAA